MPEVTKTSERRMSAPLNASNSPFGNPMEIQQDQEDQRMNNVMMLNREMEEGEEHREGIAAPQEQQMQERPVQLAVDQEIMLNATQLKEELEQLDDEFSRLGLKEKTEIKQFKRESQENKNFMARYKSRNILTEKMKRAVSVAKTKLNGADQPLGQEDLAQLNTLVQEAKIAKEQIKNEDVSLKNWEVYEENKEGMEQVMKEIVDDANFFTDSSTYYAVVRAIRKYRRHKSRENFAKLQKKVATYIKTKTHQGTKTEAEFKEKGRIRIRRMKDLAARLGLSLDEAAYKNRAQMEAASKIRYQGTAADDVIDQRTEKLKIASQRMQEAMASEREFDPLKVACEIMITDRMLEPEYVLSHLDEMRGYARQFAEARECKAAWEQKQRERPADAVKTELEKYQDRVYITYRIDSQIVLNMFARLEDYIRACEQKDEKEISTLKAEMDNIAGMMSTGGPSEEGKEICRKFYEDMYLRNLEAYRLQYVVGAHGQTRYGNSLSSDKNRMPRVLHAVRFNAQGRFASEKDREAFEKDFEMMDALYNGSTEEVYNIAVRYIEEMPMIQLEESQVTKEYLMEHFVELADVTLMDGMRENMSTLRPDVKDMINDRKGKDYIKKINAADKGFGSAIASIMDCIATTLRFNFNRKDFKRMIDEENVEEDQRMLEAELERARDILREIKKEQIEK